MRPRRFVRSILYLAFAFAVSSPVLAQSLLDTFEASTLNPLFWSKSQQYGTVSLSTEQDKTFDGKQSLKFSSVSGGQRGIGVSHRFAFPQKGTFSIWFYDVAAGQETQYEQISLYNTVTTDLASIGTQDFDAHCYEAQLYNYTTGQQQGPNQNCGLYPQISTTNVQRTKAWHLFSIFVEQDTVVLVIDNNAVFVANGNYAYDTVTILQSGPYWRPDTYSYWDDYVGPVYKAN
jgi:hypothetical protein